MAEPQNKNYFEDMFPKDVAAPAATPSAPASIGTASAPAKNYFEDLFNPPKPTLSPAQEASKEKNAQYEQRIEKWMPSAQKSAESFGRFGGLLTGVTETPIVGPAVKAAYNTVSAGVLGPLGLGQSAEHLSPEENTFANRYENERAREEALSRVYGKEAPISKFVGSVVPSLALPAGEVASLAGAGARTVGAGPLLQGTARILGYGAEGAGYGAAGATAEKYLGSKPEAEKEDVGHSALWGGALGTGFGVAGKLVGATIDKLTPEALKFRRKFEQAVQDDVKAGYQPPSLQDIANAKAAGQEMNVGDLYGPRAKDMFDRLARTNPDILSNINSELRTRAADQIGHFENLIEGIRGTSQNPAEMMQQAQELSRKLTNQTYEQAYLRNNGAGSWKPEWDKWLSSPVFRKAIQETEDTLKNKWDLTPGKSSADFESPFRQVMQVDPRTGQIVPALDPSGLPKLESALKNRANIEYIDTLQRNLNEMISNKMSPNYASQGTLGKELANVRQEILTSLTNPSSPLYNDAYAQARKMYSSFRGDSDAFSFGSNILNKTKPSDLADIAKDAAAMTPQERMLASHGLLYDLLERSKKGSSDINISKMFEYLRPGPKRDAIGEIVGQGNLDSIERFMKVYDLMNKSIKYGGPKLEGAEEGFSARKAMQATLFNLLSYKSGGILVAINPWINNNFSKAVAKDMQRKFLSNDINDFNEFYRMVSRNPKALKSFGDMVQHYVSKVGGQSYPLSTSYFSGTPNEGGMADGGIVRSQRNNSISAASMGLMKVASKPPGMADGGTPDDDLIGYHASPHIFDRFDSGKAKVTAFGHGMYFGSDPKKISEFAERQRQTGANPSIYRARLNVPREKLLDWHKPISQQHPDVQAAIGKELEAYRAKFPDNQMWSGNELTGNKAYAMLRQLHGRPKDVSERLRSHGIPGVIFGPEDSRSYNIFSDKDIEILDRKGPKAPAMADGGLAAFHEGSHPLTKHESGEPRVYYTGTSKDTPFEYKKGGFKVDRHGAWFTSDKDEASKYAITNDSQGFKRDGWNFEPTHRASRVVPVYLRAENPYRGDRPEHIYRTMNYKKAQSDWFDHLRSQGHDSWIPDSMGGNLAVILGHPGQIKSALSNTGNYDIKSPDIGKAGGGDVEGRPVRATGGRIPEIDKMFKSAKKYVDSHTKGFLNAPDDAIVRALAVAKKKI